MNPQAARGRHLFSKQVPHPAGWLPNRQKFRGEESNLRPPDSKSGIAYQQRLPRSLSFIPKRPAGLEPARPPWPGDRLPLHHGRDQTIQVFKEHSVALRRRQWARRRSNPRLRFFKPPLYRLSYRPDSWKDCGSIKPNKKPGVVGDIGFRRFEILAIRRVTNARQNPIAKSDKCRFDNRVANVNGTN